LQQKDPTQDGKSLFRPWRQIFNAENNPKDIMRINVSRYAGFLDLTFTLMKYTLEINSASFV
jgi:hypothetical protein